MNSIIVLAVLGMLTMFLGITNRKKWILPVIISGLVFALIANALEWNKNTHYYNDMLVVDNFSIAFNGVLFISTILVLMFASTYYRTVERPLEDVYALMIFSLVGGVCMTSFGNIVMLFIGIEILSICMYVLAGSKKFDLASNEASFKYFLTGSFSTGFLLLGIAFLYGATGTFDLVKMNTYIFSHANELPLYFNVGMLLVMVGLSFKLAIAPFHFWAPDVYHGSPTLITAFMATTVKIAGIAAFYKLFSSCFISVLPLWTTVLSVFAALTIIIGNVTAIYQTNMKRMLAYSSISHAGYLSLGILAMNNFSKNALLIYTLAYAVATITAFGIIILVRGSRNNDDINTFNGLARTNPIMSFALTISMLSLTGIPPLAGFIGKYFIFTSAIESGYLWLVIIAILGSALSAVYYFKPIIAVYMKKGEWEPVVGTPSYKFIIILLIVLMFLIGIIPNTFVLL